MYLNSDITIYNNGRLHCRLYIRNVPFSRFYVLSYLTCNFFEVDEQCGNMGLQLPKGPDSLSAWNTICPLQTSK